MEQDWKKIKVYTNAFEAELVKQMLDEHGVPAVTINKQDSSYLLFGKIELYVSIQDENRALQLIYSNQEPNSTHED